MHGGTLSKTARDKFRDNACSLAAGASHWQSSSPSGSNRKPDESHVLCCLKDHTCKLDRSFHMWQDEAVTENRPHKAEASSCRRRLVSDACSHLKEKSSLKPMRTAVTTAELFFLRHVRSCAASTTGCQSTGGKMQPLANTGLACFLLPQSLARFCRHYAAPALKHWHHFAKRFCATCCTFAKVCSSEPVVLSCLTALHCGSESQAVAAAYVLLLRGVGWHIEPLACKLYSAYAVLCTLPGNYDLPAIIAAAAFAYPSFPDPVDPPGPATHVDEASPNTPPQRVSPAARSPWTSSGQIPPSHPVQQTPEDMLSQPDFGDEDQDHQTQPNPEAVTERSGYEFHWFSSHPGGNPIPAGPAELPAACSECNATLLTGNRWRCSICSAETCLDCRLNHACSLRQSVPHDMQPQSSIAEARLPSGTEPNADHDQDMTCGICSESLADTPHLTWPSCLMPHRFHAQCLALHAPVRYGLVRVARNNDVTRLQDDATCPLCRRGWGESDSAGSLLIDFVQTCRTEGWMPGPLEPDRYVQPLDQYDTGPPALPEPARIVCICPSHGTIMQWGCTQTSRGHQGLWECTRRDWRDGPAGEGYFESCGITIPAEGLPMPETPPPDECTRCSNLHPVWVIRSETGAGEQATGAWLCRTCLTDPSARAAVTASFAHRPHTEPAALPQDASARPLQHQQALPGAAPPAQDQRQTDANININNGFAAAGASEGSSLRPNLGAEQNPGLRFLVPDHRESHSQGEVPLQSRTTPQAAPDGAPAIDSLSQSNRQQEARIIADVPLTASDDGEHSQAISARADAHGQAAIPPTSLLEPTSHITQRCHVCEWHGVPTEPGTCPQCNGSRCLSIVGSAEPPELPGNSARPSPTTGAPMQIDSQPPQHTEHGILGLLALTHGHTPVNLLLMGWAQSTA